VSETADDHPHDDHGAPAAALRPPASGSRPTHRGPDSRHRSRVPRSTARGWLGKASKIVVSLGVTDPRASELQQEILELRRRVKKLTALLRLALTLLRSARFTLTHERLPDGCAKIRILRAVDRAREFVPLRALLRFLQLSPRRFHAWRRLQHGCALDDRSSCPHTSPHRLPLPEIRAIKDMVTALEYRHIPTGTLAVLAQWLGKVRAPRPGTTWCGSSAGAAPGSACTRRSRRWGFERREPTRCGTSTPPSSDCSTEPARIFMP
jgi:hypothetical protein